ncbi:BamA/TamA family outer membrane protein [Novosphingobium sp. AP12]|uniref:BamA/TamA family outer membrane protein n=1 Tax=Novosphingobium sp. AP12 TaxID=1144305 RepID=UPI000271F5CE|nr:BamA/TamA family outer membrane protein [Novosphingobium sp. AP12]EJL34162.1 outer membrane protein/protective antigen OMA87 [Novosphingobium sp. AP12]
MSKVAHTTPARLGVLLPILAMGLPTSALAQNQVAEMATGSVTASTARVTAEEDPEKLKTMKPDLLVVPIPLANPTLGAGLMGAAVLFYNPNGSDSPWVSGAGGLYTSNKSWGGAAFHSMSLADDRFKVLLFGGYANININFYGIGGSAGDRDVSIKLVDKGIMGLAQGQYRVAPNLYVGARYQVMDLNTEIRRENPLFPDADLPLPEFKSTISGIGPSITYDSRDNQFAPRTGADITLVGTFNFKDLDSDFTYNKWQFAANGYFPVTSTGTLAVNGAVCAVSKGGPFYDLCMYGQAGELRGYEMGRYRDRASWAAQLEWRQKLDEKFGAVWFAGVGGIAKSLGDLGDTTMLPSAGMGLRYKASKETGINLRLDLAIGKDSQAIYFGIGEVF